MNFPKMEETLNDIKAQLSALTDSQGNPLLSEVRTLYGVPIFSELFNVMDDLARFPVAVVSSGDVFADPQFGGLIQDVEYHVFLLAETNGVPACETAAMDTHEKVMTALKGSVPGMPLKLNHIPVQLISSEKLPLRPELRGWKLLLNAKMSATF